MDMKPGMVLVVFDLDGTVSRHDTFMPFVFGFLNRHPWRYPRLLLVLPAMAAFMFGFSNRGALKGALLHHTLGGASRKAIDRWATRHANRVVKKGLFKDAVAAIASHQKAGHYLVLMSASIDCYVQRISVALGFHETICTTVVWNRNNTLNGRIQGSNIRGDKKAQQFRQLVSRLHPSESLAYGNSSADVEHMMLATRGVFVNGNPGKLPGNDRRIRVVNWH
jgi:HAD superfamily hydrolase (TIGR01490 family)